MPPKPLKNPFIAYTKQKLFNLITGNLGDIIILQRHDGKILYVSPAMKHVLGYVPEEIYEWPAYEQIHPEDAEEVKKKIHENTANQAQECTYTYRQQHKEGRYIWLEAKVNYTPEGYRGKANLLISVREITQRFITDQHLLYQKDLMKAILHFLPVSIIIQNKEGKLIFVNQTVLNFFGVQSQDIQGKYLQDLFPLDAERYLQDNQQVWQTGKESIKEDIFRTHDKVYIVLIGRKLFQAEHTGEKLLLTYAIDITDKKVAEKQLKQQRNFIRSIADTIPVIIYVYDPAENKILFFNNGFLKILGYNHAEIEAATINLTEKLVHPEDVAPLQAVYSAVWKGEKDNIELTYRMKDKAGNFRWFYSRNLAFKRNALGNITQILGFAQDVTLQKQTDEVIIKTKEAADEAMRTKDEFFSEMSHEIRTPMNAVIGMTQLLLQNNPRPDQLRLLQTLKFSGDNLLNLLNDILDFSKIGAGKIEFSESDFNLLDLIRNIHNLYKSQAEDKGLKFNIEIDNKLPSIVKGDSHRLSQILSNLLSNAVKFTHKGSISLEIIKHKEDAEFVYLWITVRDTGIGIPENKIKRIFEPFKQADSHTSRKYGGTGLGLSIIKRLVESLGGKVDVESRENEGSTFKIHYIFKKSSGLVDKSLLKTDTQQVFEPLQGLRVLYVEDVLSNQILLEELCNRWKVDLDLASDGYEALKKIKQNSYDMVLMDIQMPGMDGYETSQRIRQMKGEQFQQIPITALTADVSEKTRMSITESGMNDYLTKPINTDHLYNSLKKYARASGKEASSTDPARIRFTLSSEKTAKVVDFTLFDQLFVKSPDEYIKFLKTYLEEFDNYYYNFLKSLIEKDLELFKRTYHKINSAIHHLQMQELENLLKKANAYLSKQEEIADISYFEKELHDHFAKVNQALAEKINHLTA